MSLAKEILTTLSVIMCPHGGTAVLLSTNTNTMIRYGFCLTEQDRVHTIVGCAKIIVFQPCILLEIDDPDTTEKSTFHSTKFLTYESKGTCYDITGGESGSAEIIYYPFEVKSK